MLGRGGSIHPRLPNHAPDPPTNPLPLTGIHPRPIRRQAPTGSPLPECLDLDARSDSKGDDPAAAIVVRSPVGGRAFLLRDGLLGFTLAATRRSVLAGVGGCGGCGGHWVSVDG